MCIVSGRINYLGLSVVLFLFYKTSSLAFGFFDLKPEATKKVAIERDRSGDFKTSALSLTATCIYQMTSRFCSIVLQAPASSLRFHISTNAAKFLYSNCISSSASQKRYVGSNSRRSLTLTTPAMCCDISFLSQNVNMRLFLPTQSKLPENTSKFGQRLPGLFIGFLVCCSASQQVHAEASGESRGNSYSHGKEVYTDYSVIGEWCISGFYFLFLSIFGR